MHDAILSPQTLLRLAPGVRTRFDAAGHVLLDAPNGTVVDLGPRGFTTLSLFSEPLALGEAIDRLEHDVPATDFAPAVNVINMLLDEGALVRSDADGEPTSGWADPVEHARMLHDDRRTHDYLAALAGPFDRVTSCSTSAPEAECSRSQRPGRGPGGSMPSRPATSQRSPSRCSLSTGWTTRSRWSPVGRERSSCPNEPTCWWRRSSATSHWRRRSSRPPSTLVVACLKPDARLIPHDLTLMARPLLLPDGEARQRAIGHAAVERWRELYDMEFQPLLDAAIPGPVNMPTEAEVAAAWPPVGPPVVLAKLDLTSFEDASVSASADLVVDAPGAVNAVAVTFRADLYGTVAHTLDPWTWPTSSWATSVCVLPDALHVGPGAVLRVHYSRRAQGAPDGLTCEVVGP